MYFVRKEIIDMLTKYTIIATVTFATVQCLVLIPERANVTEFDEKYVLYPKIWISRLSRKSPYFINIEGNIKHMWGNNLTMHFVFYEFLNNEYRRTFMEIHSPLCELLGNFPIRIGAMLAERGVVCPVPEGHYTLYNMTLPMTNFRYSMPFEKFKAEAWICKLKNHTIAKGYMYATTKKESKKTRNFVSKTFMKTS